VATRASFFSWPPERSAKPIATAIGIVAAIVKTPHGDSASAFTTTSPRTARRMTEIAVMLTRADEPREGPHLVAHHLPERLAAAPDRAEEDDAVVHGPAKDGADQDPEEAGKVAELRGEHRARRAGRAGDGREVMAEDDPAVRPHEVLAVGLRLGGRGPQLVDRQHVRHQPRRVEAVGEGERARRGDDHPEGAHRLAPREGQDRNAARPGCGDGAPTGNAGDFSKGVLGRWGHGDWGSGEGWPIRTIRSSARPRTCWFASRNGRNP
jgi:hypothetical protein